MKKLVGLVLLACGLFVYPCLSFAENYYADIIITPSAYTGFFGGLAGGDGNPGPNSIDWGIGNSVPFGSMTDDMVFSTSTGDFMVGSNWKERMRITKDGNVGIGTTSPLTALHVSGNLLVEEGTPNFYRAGKFVIFNPNFDETNTHAVIATGDSGSPSTMDLRLQAGNDDSSTGITIKSNGNVGIGTVHTNEKLTVAGNIQVLGNKILIYGPGDPTYSDVLLSLGNSTPNTGEIWGLFSKGVDGTFNIGRAYVAATLTITPSENVGIGTTNPSEKLEVEGYVKAYGFNTGDIIFRKDDKPVWRMYEDEKGLYVQSLTTDKNYALVLDEMVNGVANDKFQQLQEKNEALEEANKSS